MDNGNGGLNDKFEGLTVNDEGKDSSLLKVFRAVEAAEAVIRLKEEENNRLKAELLKRNQELEHLKVVKSVAQRYYSIDSSDEHRQGVDRARQTTFQNDSLGTLTLHETLAPKAFFPAEGHSDDSRSNGNFNTHSVGQTAENAGFSPISSPTSFSPRRYPKDEEYEPRINVPAQGLMPVAESNNPRNLWNEIRDLEKEVIQLRKHLTEFSIKEAQIRNEKYVLEKRIAQMRMVFDQQQQDVVDAASKALFVRQDVIEENVSLTYALQDAQQERTTFVSSLLPLLAEYSLQPQVLDAQSIVGNIKLLFKHLQEKLIMTESKLKESQYQLTPWRSDRGPNFTPQSPELSSDAALASNKIGLELVHRPIYSSGNPLNSNSQARDWDSRGQHAFHVSAIGPSMQNSELDNMGRFSPLPSRDSDALDAPARVAGTHDESHVIHKRHVKFKDPVSRSEVYAADMEGSHSEREHAGTWGSGCSPYSDTVEDPSYAYSPNLQPVLEEPSSSFSEAADDDPLPAIEDLQISGEPYPGRQLQACGYSINGTTSCNFEWVRHLEDGSVKYIDGAKQPIYLVTADDVEAYLAIEVQPLDDRKRKGELVRVFANEHSKIICDPAMQSHIEQNLRNGHASYKVSLSTNFLRIWEPATLTIKREGYSIKGSGKSDVAISEKFSPGTKVSITHGLGLELSIFSNSGTEHLLQAEDTIEDIVSVRDTIVLTLRLFIMKAMQKGKGKGKKRGIFFK
ncbi:uncharacterized protein LOC141642860 isoform X3 [Silene latifolia]|uniref:uncharacterized protein LOC141642860 isoform X3 n=1 Tax=Silene latifolia TaxID=37657 RepID=UPI003D78A57B